SEMDQKRLDIPVQQIKAGLLFLLERAGFGVKQMRPPTSQWRLLLQELWDNEKVNPMFLQSTIVHVIEHYLKNILSVPSATWQKQVNDLQAFFTGATASGKDEKKEETVLSEWLTTFFNVKDPSRPLVIKNIVW